MTLARRMWISTGALLASLLMIVGVSLWAIYGLDQNLRDAADGLDALGANMDAALAGHERYSDMLPVAANVFRARGRLETGQFDPDGVVAELTNGLTRLEQYIEEYGENDATTALADALHRLIKEINRETAETLEAKAPQYVERISDEAMASIRGYMIEMGESIRETIRASEAQREQAKVLRRLSTRRRQVSVILLVTLGAVILIAATRVGVAQYRAVIRPLRRLRDGVREIAGGRFDKRVDEKGDEEFASLAADFNQTSRQLEEFYRNLEQKVQQKSRELVRSERLASVGFLAAGVAHEINNPLGIISGYAELTLKQMDREDDGGGEPEATREALTIIRDESFRCKEIIEKLLSLARGGDENRGPVPVKAVADDVVSLVKGLKRYREREAVVGLDEDPRLEVIANETELKQVLLNLVVNGLEAVDETGRVTITGWREADAVIIEVADNGRGMDAATLERAFEPFFTHGTREGRKGTGLGLSITHAIVENLGGTINAESDGVGRGSRFTVRLPAATETPI